MENQCLPFPSFACVFPPKSMEEMRVSLWGSSMELEESKLVLQEMLRSRDSELVQLKLLLNQAMKERDEANDNFQKLFLEQMLAQQQCQTTTPLSAISGVEDEPRRGFDHSNNGFSSSDCEESIVSSPPTDLSPPLMSFKEIDLVCEKPLPEKGKLLQAVMKAGPLLQTILLAGPLPQWRHPPPPLDSVEIPPVKISSPPPPQLLSPDFLLSFNGEGANRKRVLLESFDSPSGPKYPRISRCSTF